MDETKALSGNANFFISLTCLFGVLIASYAVYVEYGIDHSPGFTPVCFSLIFSFVSLFSCVTIAIAMAWMKHTIGMVFSRVFLEELIAFGLKIYFSFENGILMN